MVWKYYKIRFKSRGNNPVKSFKLCTLTGYFGLFVSTVIQAILETIPVAIIVLCGVAGLKWVDRPRVSCCMAIVLLKAFVLLSQARLSVIFLFYNRSRVAPWIYLWVFVFKSAICPWLCFSNCGNDGWVKWPDTKGSSSLCNSWFLSYSFFSVFIFKFSEGLSYHLLQVASRDQVRIEIFNILFNVRLPQNLTQAREFIGKFYHLFHGYSNKNLHFPCINIAQIHLR